MTVILALETSTQTCSVALLCKRDEQRMLLHRSLEGPSGHAQSVFPLIDALLTEAGLTKSDLSAIAFGQGPGAFTGLRLATGVAQGMGMALGLKVLPVGSLHAVAAAVLPAEIGTIIVAALDARMDEVYLAAYLVNLNGQLTEISPPLLVPSADVVSFVVQRSSLWVRAFKAQAHPASALESQDVLQVCAVQLIGEGWQIVPGQSGFNAASVQGTDNAIEIHFHTVNQTQLPDACLIAQIAYEHWQAGGGIAPEHAAPLYLRDKVAFTSAERAAGEGGNPKADKLVQAALLPMMRHDLSEVFSLECSVQSFPWTLKNFDDALAAGYEAWVLRSELGLLGFCVAMAAPDVTHILVIAVARDAQRQGYASHLLEHVSRNAKARSAEGLLLEVRPSNTDARIFYEKAGFQQIGLRKNYYPAARGQREDALILKKTFVDA